MLLAHTLTPGGPDLEMILVAAGMLVLGVVFFFQRSVKPIVSLGLVAGSLAVGTGAFALGAASSSGSGAEISIVAPGDGALVPARRPVSIRVELSGGSLASSNRAGDEGGHLHVFVDGRLRSMPLGVRPEVRLPPGDHSVRVEYVANDHTSFDPPILAEVRLKAR
jgi:hypothetical protein